MVLPIVVAAITVVFAPLEKLGDGVGSGVDAAGGAVDGSDGAVMGGPQFMEVGIVSGRLVAVRSCPGGVVVDV